MDSDQVNTELVDTVVREVKSQGLFDQFRKECQADVDTKPAYQNLRQRVENEVTTFLEQEEWRADANRIQMREKLRKNIIGLSFLETGVDRIVDQVVNPKISTVFLPQIEDVVYKYLGIEKPQVRPKEEPQVSTEHNGEMKMDLLPTDLLEAVSPDSTQSDKSKFSAEGEIKQEITEEEIIPELNESDDRIDDEESPPFEPLEGRPASSLKKEEDDSQSSHVSGISGLTSQDSVYSGKNAVEPMEVDEVKAEEPEQPEEVMQPPRIDQMVEKSEVPERTVSDVVEAMEVGNQDSQLSQVSSNSRLSIVTNESDSKDGSLKIDLSEEAQMPEFGENPENSKSPKQEKITTFDIKKDEIKFQQVRIFAQPPGPENPPPLPPSPPPIEEKPQLPAVPEAEAKTEEVSSSVEQLPSAEKVENPNDRESRKDRHTSDRKKSKKSSRSSSSHHNHHHRDRNREKSRSSSSREKNSKPPEPKQEAKEEDNSSTAIDSDASPVLQIVEAETVDGQDLAKGSPTDGKEKSDGKSKGGSHHRTSHRDDKKRSHSSHSKDSHRRDHRRHEHRKSSSQKSSSRSDKKTKEEGSSKKKDKETDDHSIQREKNSEKRRSTDRDSNDGKSGPNQPTASASGAEKTTASQSTSSTGRESHTNSSVSNSPKDSEIVQGAKPEANVASSSSDASEKVTLQTKPIIVDQILTANSEINLQMIVNRASNDPTLAKIEELAKKSLAKKKPKFASNFKEAKRLMKMRKKIDHESKKNMEKAMVLAKNYINSKAENDPTVSDLSQGIELEFVCMKSDGKTSAGPIISSPVKADAPKFPPMTPVAVKKETSKGSIENIGDSEDEEDLLYFPDDRSKHQESITEKWWREKGQKMFEDRPKSDQKTKKTPKNGLIHPNPNIRTKRSLELNDLKGDLPEDKRVKLTLNKFGDLNGNEAVIEDKKIPKVKTPITQQQRYSSDDLYKPRPMIHGQRTRRRGLDTSDGGTA